ncbi:hypothetical protein LA080_012672 [Diaporthe eres]|nr:hypothetical protein LA080_012672 [Diaporthe eres]
MFQLERKVFFVRQLRIREATGIEKIGSIERGLTIFVLRKIAANLHRLIVGIRRTIMLGNGIGKDGIIDLLTPATLISWLIILRVATESQNCIWKIPNNAVEKEGSLDPMSSRSRSAVVRLDSMPDERLATSIRQDESAKVNTTSDELHLIAGSVSSLKVEGGGDVQLDPEGYDAIILRLLGSSMADRRTDGTLSDDQSSATLANDASVPNNDVASSALSHAFDDDAAGPGEDAPGVERCGWARITPS